MGEVNDGIRLGITLLSLASGLSAQTQDPRQLAQNTFPSVVILLMQDANGQPVSLGSGFFVRPDVVATNIHVIEGAAGGYARVVGQSTKYRIAAW